MKTLTGGDTFATSVAREKAAQAWCKNYTSEKVMDTDLTEAFAEILTDYIEALQWCGGSADFQIEGKARKGWESIVIPLIT